MISNPDQLPSISDYQNIRTIGDGLTSKVKLVLHRNKHQYFAMKCIKRSKDAKLDRFLKYYQNEISILRNLQHPNLIKMIESFENCERTKINGEIKYYNAIVFELAHNGDMFEFINSEKFSEDLARTYFHQLIEGITFLQEKQISHKDIKLENLLIAKDFTLKIGDFGCASLINNAISNENDNSENTNNFNFINKPLEVSKKPCFNVKENDIFCAGVALFMMITRQLPYKYNTEKSDPYYKYFIEKNEKLFWEKYIKENQLNSDHFSPCFIDIINRMLAFDPKQRISLVEIKTHPWYLGDILMMDQMREEMSRRVPRKEDLKLKLDEKIQLIKHKKQGKDIVFHGIPPFRSFSSNGEENSSILTEFPDLKQVRILAKYDNTEINTKINCYYTRLEPQKLIFNLFKCLIAFRNMKFLFGLEFNSNSNKICATFKENEDNIIIRMNVFSIDQETNAIEFLKKYGNNLKFYDIIENIKKEMEELE